MGKKSLISYKSAPGFCEPITNDENDAVCKSINRMALNRISTVKPDIVVLNSHWIDASKPPYFNGNGDYSGALLSFLGELKKMGVRKIIIVGQIPIWQTALPDSLIDHFVMHNRPIPTWTFLGLYPRSLKMDADMRTIHYPEGVTYISATDALCDNAGCRTSLGPTQGAICWYGTMAT